MKPTDAIDLNQLTKIQPELPADHQSFRQIAQSLEVTDEASYQKAGQMIERQKAWDASVEGFFEKASKAAYDLWQSIVSTGGPKKEMGLIAKFKAPMAVRGILEPRMKEYTIQRDRQRREAEERARREAQEAERKAREEAQRIQAEAQRQADELRRQGEMRLAREAQERAKQEALDVVQEAEDAAAMGVILPDEKPVGGPQEARPWEGEVTDMRALCRAIGGECDISKVNVKLEQAGFDPGDIAAILEIIGQSYTAMPLEYMTPVRLNGIQPLPLVVVDRQVLDNLAKRMGREDLGIPGIRGVRGLQLRFSGKAAPAVAQRNEGDGW